MNRAVSCPYCHCTLYRLRPQQDNPKLSEYVERAPLVKSDPHGTFTTCLRCACRVLLVARQTTLGMDAFELAHLQAV